MRAWCGAGGPGVPVTGPIAPPPPLAVRQILHTIPALPLPADLCLRTEYLTGSQYPRSQQVDPGQPLPFYCYCVLAPPAAAPPSSLVPLPLGNWYSATACRSRAQGSRKDPRSGSSPKAYVDVDHCAHCSFYVCSAVTSSGLNTTDRSRTTSVSLDKFVLPSLDIVCSHSCSTSRGSSRSSKPVTTAHLCCLHLPRLLFSTSTSPRPPCLAPTRLSICVSHSVYLATYI